MLPRYLGTLLLSFFILLDAESTAHTNAMSSNKARVPELDASAKSKAIIAANNHLAECCDISSTP